MPPDLSAIVIVEIRLKNPAIPFIKGLAIKQLFDDIGKVFAFIFLFFPYRSYILLYFSVRYPV